jgi:hypothetical protein
MALSDMIRKQDPLFLRFLKLSCEVCDFGVRDLGLRCPLRLQQPCIFSPGLLLADEGLP